MMATDDYVLFTKAIKEDDLEAVELLVRQGCDPSEVDDATGLNCLHLAVLEGRCRIVERLSRDGALVNSECRKNLPKHRLCRGYTPLHVSCTTGNIEITELLLSRGASISVDDDRCTGLHVAVGKEHPRLVELLLKTDPSCANCRDYLGRTALHYTAKNTSSTNVDTLLRHGVDVQLVDDEGMTVLHLAASEANDCVVRTLMKYANCIINVQDNYKWTALHWAVYKNNITIVKLLLNSNEFDDIYNRVGCDYKHIISYVKYSLEIEALKRVTADVNLCDRGDNGALQIAVQDNKWQIVKLLLKYGPDLQVGDNSALYIAVKYGFIQVLAELLKYGANIDLNALKIAYNKNQYEVFRCLAVHGWNLRLDDLYKLLDDAIVNHNVDFVRVIMSCVRITFVDDHLKLGRVPERIYNFVRYCVSWIDGKVPCYVRTGDSNECVMSFIHNNYQALRLWFLDKFPEAISPDFTAKLFMNDTLKEVELMGGMFLGNSNVTVLDLIEKDLDELVNCLRNEELVNGLKSLHDFEVFPICREILRIHVDRGLRRRCLLDECVKYFPLAYSNCPGLLPELVEIILNLLANKDLSAFVFACGSLI